MSSKWIKIKKEAVLLKNSLFSMKVKTNSDTKCTPRGQMDLFTDYEQKDAESEATHRVKINFPNPLSRSTSLISSPVIQLFICQPLHQFSFVQIGLTMSPLDYRKTSSFSKPVLHCSACS